MIFDKKYYDDIWGHIGGVHRHDYTESLANQLIQKYGRVRILDCGTGCGHLVKMLRERGCDAWGFDVSDYALDNCCAPGYVVKAHASELPFPDKYFDVVHSNGLFGYDEDVDSIAKELWRVGKTQDHNIDTSENEYPDEFRLIKLESREWWDKKLERPNKVLVTCPVYDGKEYCWQQWIDMAKSLTYPNYDIFVVDNSKTIDFYNKYKDQIPMVHREEIPGEKDDAMYRVCQSMGIVREHFLKGDYDYWMNIESDNIPPPNVIETLFQYSGGGADWVAHTYSTGSGFSLMAGIGCSLLSRKLMTDFNWSDPTIADDSPDAELWNWVQKQGGYKTVELYYIMDVKHLK
jgi:ubiquinone/menaquinone biosynthesis C-methylase UbiE